MIAFQIKLCGLNDADTSSLKSMLNLAQKHLTHDWELVTSDQADLFIYSFDSDEGKNAWQQHDPQYISALLSQQDSSSESVDVILKKPLRTKNFSAALNNIELKIKEKSPTDDKKAPIAKSTNKSPQKKYRSKKSKPFLSKISSILPGFLNNKTGSTAPFSNLNFSVPEQSSNESDTIVQLPDLKKWLESIRGGKENIQKEDLLSNLIPLNRFSLPTQDRFALLELYCKPISLLIVRQNNTINNLRQASHSKYTKEVNSLSLLIAELILGFKIIVTEYLHNKKKSKYDDYFLVSLNRLAEYLSLSVMHAYCTYRLEPPNSIKDLHLLYLFCDQNNVLAKEYPSVIDSSPTSFIIIYKATLLTGIANPSRLLPSEILHLFSLMADYASAVTISHSVNTQDQSPGNFQIDLLSDAIPIPLAEISESKQSEKESRQFNTQVMLQTIEQLFQQDSLPSDNTNLRLLKKVIPQCNSTYSRQFKREQLDNNNHLNVLVGLEAIHDSILTNSPSSSIRCIIRNRSVGGLLISSDSLNSYHLKTGDIVALFESDSKPILASVSWLITDDKGVSNIGLELQAEHAVAVTMALKNKNDSFLGLILPRSKSANSQKTILVKKGTYLPLQTLNITEDQKTYRISIDSLIDDDLNCEQFIFNIKTD